MRRRLSPFIALLCALVLLGAQQAAYAHWIGHLGAATTATAAPQGGDGDGLPHDCTTCTGLFASFGAAPPAAPPLAVADCGATQSLTPSYQTHLPAEAAAPYPARAPPAVL